MSTSFFKASVAVRLCLPWPPSANRYWRHVGPRVLISREGRAYRHRVGEVVQLARERGGIGSVMVGPVSVRVQAYPPDRRRRDMDNLGKALLDALWMAGVFEDDYQVARLSIERGAVYPGGELLVDIRELGDSKTGETDP